MALSDGLVGYWSPWLGSSGYRLLDRTVRGNHGTLTNMDAGTDWVGATVRGRSGRALDLDGVNDFVLLGTPNVVTSGMPFFVSAWFKTAVNANQSILAKSVAGSAAHRFWFTTETGSVTVNGTLGASGVSATFSTNYTDGNWHCLSALYHGTVMSLFYDGALRSSATITQLEPSNHTLIFGKYNDASGGATGTIAQFNGQIAEVAMFNSVLTNSDVLELFRLGPGWYKPYQRKRYGFVGGAGFKAYWAKRQSQLIGGGV